MKTVICQNNNPTLQPPISNTGLGDELFEIFANFDDDFICAAENRDNEPPQEREEFDPIDELKVKDWMD